MKKDLYLKKHLGQYFLKDQEKIARIIDLLEPKPGDTVMEIGPGSGVLTFPLSERVKEVIAVEIDPRMCALLKKDNIRVIQKDFLKLDLREFPADVKIISNLPYYITTPIITKLIDKFDLMVFTMQEEVARRLVSGPGGKEYGSISIFVQFYYKVEIIEKISRKCFFPVPKVDSCVVRFVKRKPPELSVPHEFLFKVVRSAFAARRKMLKNNLKGFANIENVSMDLSRRSETLSIKEFCILAQELYERY